MQSNASTTPQAPTDAEIEAAFALVLREDGDQGPSANLTATVRRLQATRGWVEDTAYAVYRCGVQLYDWDWDGFEREQAAAAERLAKIRADHRAQLRADVEALRDHLIKFHDARGEIEEWEGEFGPLVDGGVEAFRGWTDGHYEEHDEASMGENQTAYSLATPHRHPDLRHPEVTA